jgi:hypothetical protein
VPPIRTRWYATIALFSALPAVADTQTVEATVIDAVAPDVSTCFPKCDYVAPGYADSAQGHWHDLTPPVVALRLPDGRIAIAYCKAHHYLLRSYFNTSLDHEIKFCPSPVVNAQINAALTAHKAKLNWISGDSKPQHETYQVLAVLDAVAPTSAK